MMIIIHILQAIVSTLFAKHCTDIAFNDKKINPYERAWFSICMVIYIGVLLYNCISIAIILNKFVGE